MKLYFVMGGHPLIIKVEGKVISFANHSTNFTRFIPIAPFIEKTKGKEKLKEFNEYLKKLPENKMKDYVIKEFQQQGFVFKGVKDE